MSNITSRVSVLEEVVLRTEKTIEQQSQDLKEHQKHFDEKMDGLIDSLNSNTAEMRETRFDLKSYEDAKKKEDEIRDNEIEELKKSVDNIYTHYRKPIERLIASQNNRDKIRDSMLSNGGKNILWIIGISIAITVSVLLGVEPSSLFKGGLAS